MPLYTLKHCLICFKEEEGGGKTGEDEASKQCLDADSVKKALNNARLCTRFCTLASRYLDLDPFHFHPLKTINTNQIYCYDKVCDNCVDLVSSFCDIYQQIEYLQLQLSWRAMEISQVMKQANEEGKETYRKALEEKLINMGSNMEEIDDFRTDFIDSIRKMRAESNPKIKLTTENVPDDEDPDFIVVKVTRPVEKKRRLDRSVNAEKSVARPINESPTPPAKKKAVSSFSSNEKICSSKEDQMIIIKQVQPTIIAKKRPKISIRNIKADNLERIIQETGNGLDPDIPTMGCSTNSSSISESTLSDTTVIILNDNTDEIVDPILKDISSQYQDNLLNRVGEDNNCDDDVLPWEVDLSAETDEVKSANNGVIGTTSSRVHSSNRYYQQFNFLQYKCPFPECGRQFNTMTRMTIHQKATGHNLNAIITITPK